MFVAAQSDSGWSMRFGRLAVLAAWSAVSLGAADAARGELFELANGGRLRGELVNRDELPRATYVIKLAGGGQVVLPRAAVKEVVVERPALVEYEQLRQARPDTVEGHWELAEWCRERNLSTQRRVHLERIIDLEPDHLEARRGLGYSRHDGQWKTQEQIMAQRGYVRYGSQWRLPQEIKLIEERKRLQAAEGAWFRELKRLRKDLESPEKARVAQERIRRIDQPVALKALREYFDKERVEAVKLLYLEAIANLGTPGALALLTDISLFDEFREVRLSALDYLKKHKHPDVVRAYVAGLRHKDNRVVNRAALGLAAVGDESVLAPLIDALQTTHTFKVVTGSPGMSNTFQTGGPPLPGGSGFSFGQKTHIIKQQMRNEAVRDALIHLSGVNFGYDEQRWRAWLAQQRPQLSEDFRRDNP